MDDENASIGGSLVSLSKKPPVKGMFTVVHKPLTTQSHVSFEDLNRAPGRGALFLIQI